MAIVPANDFYYCVLAYVTNIDNNKIHCDKNFKYTCVYMDNEHNKYIDIINFKPIKSIDSHDININEWYIISKTKIDLKHQKYQKEYLRKIIRFSLPKLENELKKIEFNNQKILKK